MDAPVPKLAELLRHPDDLDKIAALKEELGHKKMVIDVQLRVGLRDQLETAQSGMSGLTDAHKTLQLIKEEMIKIDKLCADSQDVIKDFASVNQVSQAERNFTAVETMRKNLETFSDRLGLVERMLGENEVDKENMPHLLPCHYELTQLRNIRDDAMEQIQRADDPSLQTTLEDYFERLDERVAFFDEHIDLLAANLISLVVNDNNGPVVRFAVVIDVEERSDERILALQEALRNHKDMAVRFPSITDGAKKPRGYKQRFLNGIRAGAEQQFSASREAFLDDPTRLDKIVRWFFDDLNAVKMGMASLVPKRWNILTTYGGIYHAQMHDFLLSLAEDPAASSAHTLEIAGWPEKYYKKMAKLGFSQDELSPHVIDQREGDLIKDFRQLIIKFLDEWIARIFKQEQKDLAGRNVEGSNLDHNEFGHFRNKNLVGMWRMLREQIDAATNSRRTDVVDGVVDAMFLRLRDRQLAWQKMLEDEAARYESAAAPADLDGFQALQDWLVATANDQIACIDDNEDDGRFGYLTNFKLQAEQAVSPSQLERLENEISSLRDSYVDFSTWCITKFVHLIFAVDFRTVLVDHFFVPPKWYAAATMTQIVVTFDEYIADYRQVLHPSLVDIFVEIFADDLLVRYLSCVHNRGAKFRRADPFRDKLLADTAAALDHFAALSADAAASIRETWAGATDILLALLTCDRDAVPDTYERFKRAYWDLHISWVEAVLRARDDFDRSMLNALKSKAAHVESVRGPDTIMGRVK